MTNLERHERGISTSNLCSQCNDHPESILHLLRDCEGILEIWEKLVEPNEWHLFASLNLERWLRFNLQKSSMGNLRWNWSILFASMIHLIWIDRNHYVFSRKSVFPDQFLPKLFGHVDALETQLIRRPVPSYMAASSEVQVQWSLPPTGTMKLNTDGSCCNGLAACSGLIRNHHGQFIKGFHCNLGTALPLFKRNYGASCLAFVWQGVWRFPPCLLR